MLTAEEIDEAREDLEAELVDSITVRWKDGTTTDPDTLENVPNWQTRQTAVPALIIKSIQAERVVQQGEAPIVLRTYEVTVPVGTTVKVGDQIQVDESHDPDCDGAQLWVRDVRMGSLSISRRVLAQQEV